MVSCSFHDFRLRVLLLLNLERCSTNASVFPWRLLVFGRILTPRASSETCVCNGWAGGGEMGVRDRDFLVLDAGMNSVWTQLEYGLACIRRMQTCTMYHGVGIAMFRGNPRFLADDILLVRPSLFAAVPRVLTRIYAKVLKPQLLIGTTPICRLAPPSTQS